MINVLIVSKSISCCKNLIYNVINQNEELKIVGVATNKKEMNKVVSEINVDIILQSIGRDSTKDITFTVSLDENNKLKAKIVDTETGASSKSSITLVSRTIEERLQMDDYTISDSKLSSAKKVAAGAGVAIAGGGLLARVNAALKEKNESEQKISEPAEEQTESIENTSNNEEEFSVDDEVVIDGIKHEIYRGYESGSRGNYGIKCKEK